VRRALRLLSLVVLAWQGSGPARADDGMSCPGGVVSVGDARVDVLGKCGAPTLVESRPAQVTEWVGDRYQGAFRTVGITLETWTYDLGSSRLVQYVKIEAGKVVNVRSGGYGRGPGNRRDSVVPRAPCDPTSIRAGDSTYEVLSLCGEPVFRDVREEQVTVAEGDGVWSTGATTWIVKETWTYDFGPRALVRFVLVRDGRVTGVRTGSYGYSQ
jgi:Protein of unknown function (DUF2845)